MSPPKRREYFPFSWGGKTSILGKYKSGIGEFLAQLIHTVGTDDKCAGILEDLIGWVVEKLDGDTDTFKKYI